MRWLRSLDPQLAREVWLLQLGGIANSFGNGLVLPFLVIYLHDVRGFGLGVAGLVVAVSAAAQLTAGLVAGPLVDRAGAKNVLAGGLVMQAVGFGLFPLVLGIGLGGLTGGLIASVAQPASFTVLFLVDAATFLAYVAVLAFIHDPGVAGDEHVDEPASYRAVLRDRLFGRLWRLNFLFVAAGYSLINLVPPFARDHSGLSERQIGIVFFVNTGVIVVAQLPISRAIEGWRVLPRACAPGARRRDRARSSPRAVLRRPLAVVGARGDRRSRGGRLPARRSAVHALGDRSVCLRRRVARRAADGVARSGPLPPHSADRGGTARAGHRRCQLRSGKPR
jgi:MFS family permease